MVDLKDTDPELVTKMQELFDSYGPAGVLKVAGLMIQEMRDARPMVPTYCWTVYNQNGAMQESSDTFTSHQAASDDYYSDHERVQDNSRSMYDVKIERLT
jgi:hypothetical protein